MNLVLFCHAKRKKVRAKLEPDIFHLCTLKLTLTLTLTLTLGFSFMRMRSLLLLIQLKLSTVLIPRY